MAREPNWGSSESTLRDRVQRLFKYLAERSRLKSRVVSDILNSKTYETVLWLEELLPQVPEVWSVHRNEPDPGGEEDEEFEGADGDVLLEQELVRIERVTASPAPKPPADCVEWIRGGEDSVQNWHAEPPSLLELILVDNPDYDELAQDGNAPQYLERRLSEFPPIAGAWQAYLEQHWLPWQTERKRLEPVIHAYGRLFDLRAIADRDEEECELIVAGGLLSWRPDAASSAPVYRHLVTIPVRIDLDSRSGMLRVVTEQDTPAPRLETEMLPPAAVPRIDGLSDLEKGEQGQARVLVPSPLHGRAIAAALRPWANRLHAEATVTFDANAPQRPSHQKAPIIAFAPALILRKRPATSLTVAFDQCEQQVRDGGQIPFNIARVVEQLDEALDPIDQVAPNDDVVLSEDAEPLFPKPSNDEQYRIAKRLRRSKGVLVQGPPGTGKTHTIANLICDLLAQGKRILVTSAKARPLMVLHEKLPDEVKPLCLTSLGGGRDEADQLKRSVGGILKHFEEYDREVNARDVQERTQTIKAGRARKGELIAERRRRMEIETAPQRIADGTYQGSAMQVIDAVRRDTARYGWFRDAIRESERCPFTSLWTENVAAALRAVPAELRQELRLAAPTVGELMDASAFRLVVDRGEALAAEQSEVNASIAERERVLTVRQAEESAPLVAELEKAQARKSDAENQLAVERRRAERERLRVQRQEEPLRAAHKEQVNRAMLEFDRREAPLNTEARRIVDARPSRDVGRDDRLGQALRKLDVGKLAAAVPHTSALRQGMEDMAAKGWKWPAKAVAQCLAGSVDKWRRHLDEVAAAAKGLPDTAMLASLDELHIRIAPEIDGEALVDDAEERLRYFEAGGSRGFIFKPQIVKRTDYLSEVTVDGVSCSKLTALRQLSGYLKAERQLKSISDLWAQVSQRWTKTPQGQPLATTAKLAAECAEALAHLLASASKIPHEVALSAASAPDVSTWSEAVRSELLARERHESDVQKWTKWRDDVTAKLAAIQEERNSVVARLKAEVEDEVSKLRAAIPVVDETLVTDAADEAKLLQEQLDELRERVADREEIHIAPMRRRKAEVENELKSIMARKGSTRQAALRASHAPDSHPLCGAIVEAVDDGNANAYADALARLQQLDLYRPAYGKLTQLLEDLAAIAPKAAAHIVALSGEDSITTTLADFGAAWNWARANTWVTDFRSRGLAEVDAEVARIEAAVNDAVAQKAALLSWHHCREAATQKQQEALKAWEKAVKKIGKGKGKYAARSRRQALQHMRVAQGMIPALVSPLSRLVESLPVRPHMFDVVIVDEASQLGPEGVLLFYIGERVVVVGDDEQISPEDVGLDRTQVHALIHRYLKDVAVRDSLEDSSLFDQADVRFTEGRIMLREHFRCVPEIIAFSNQLCYRDETDKPMLVPLRTVTGNRLHPPLKTAHVPTGFKTDAGINEVEADAVVRVIVDCHNDPRYENKTFGVVSLLGKPQAEHIYRRLVDALGTDSLNSREIVCGDAYSFQGDERDVMFLSMVIANNAAYAALTKRTDRQRFNVAASRARDQMWLFHSVTLNDLKPEDLRYRLLDHCTAVEEQRAYFLDDELAKCDSDFEREVARRIWAEGYRVRCQHRVAHYRIDLVVEGANGNHLAVECDGDRYHPPEKYDEDLKRQRVLERCGWRFWRVWGSDFAADPNTALKSLWLTLQDQNVAKSA